VHTVSLRHPDTNFHERNRSYRMSLVFYWHPTSSASPVASALAELEVPHERVLIDIRGGEQRTPEYLAINPNGQVPCLVVDGTPMFEGLAILLWLGGRYGVDRGLWPSYGTPAQLQALSWSSWAQCAGSACGAASRVINRTAHPRRG